MNEDKPDKVPVILKPLLLLFLKLHQLATYVKAKINQFIDWVLNKIVTWLIIYYMGKLDIPA